MAGQIDQRAHEKAVVGRARQILHEGAVDFDEIEGEAPQILEGCMAGPEIVHRHLGAKPPDLGDDARGGVNVFDGAGFGDLDGQAVGDVGRRTQVVAQPLAEIRTMHGLAGDIDR